MTEIITRAEAIEKGLKRYFTGKPCKHGHVAERLTSARTCCECKRLKEQAAEYKSLKTAYFQSDKYKEYDRSEGRRAASRVSCRNRHYANPHLRAAGYSARLYPASIVPLTEAEQSRMRWFYATARELSKRTGRKYHVDHCFPQALGGLHHPLNLMILPAWVNQKKSSKYQPDNPLAVRGLHLKARLSLRIQQP